MRRTRHHADLELADQPSTTPMPEAASDRVARRSHPKLPSPLLLRAKILDVFGADLRSLALFRIVLAAIVLMDLAARLGDLTVHYTDAGVLPRDVAERGLNDWRWSLNFLSGSLAFQQLVFAATALAALALLLGYRTRLMTVIVWGLVFSIQTRNQFVLSAADTYIRLMLFWSIFLPLGAWWSLDRRRQATSAPRLSMKFVSMGTVGLFLQIAFVYWFTAALKSDPPWRKDGTALYYAFGAEHLTKPLGEYLHQFPSLLEVLTFSSLGLEIVAPILLFTPFFTGPIRTMAALSIMAFHLGIYLTLDIGLFPWIGAFSMICFFPSWFWDTALPKLGVLVPRRFSWAGRHRWRPMTEPVQAMRAPVADWLAAWSSANPGRDMAGQTAAVQLQQSQSGSPPAPAPSLAAGPHPPPDLAPVRLRSSIDVNIAATFFLLVIFAWNMTSVSSFAMSSSSLPVVYGLGLYQRWNMFAPEPVRSTKWYVYEGTLQDGRSVDVLAPIVRHDPDRIQDVSWSQPDRIASDLYGDKYWRKYLGNLDNNGKSLERNAFTTYVCRSWDEHHTDPADQLVSVQIFAMVKQTLPDYQSSRPIQTSIFRTQCP